jgi:hypothetical protein
VGPGGTWGQYHCDTGKRKFSGVGVLPRPGHYSGRTTQGLPVSWELGVPTAAGIPVSNVQYAVDTTCETRSPGTNVPGARRIVAGAPQMAGVSRDRRMRHYTLERSWMTQNDPDPNSRPDRHVGNVERRISMSALEKSRTRFIGGVTLEEPHFSLDFSHPSGTFGYRCSGHADFSASWQAQAPPRLQPIGRVPTGAYSGTTAQGHPISFTVTATPDGRTAVSALRTTMDLTQCAAAAGYREVVAVPSPFTEEEVDTAWATGATGREFSNWYANVGLALRGGEALGELLAERNMNVELAGCWDRTTFTARVQAR